MPRPPGHGPGYEIKRQEIIDRAAALFAKQGYAATGIAELLEETGVARGALYYYIGSKENLLVEIQDRVMRPLLVSARRIATLDDDPVLRLRMLSQALLENILARLDHVWVYEHDYRNLKGTNRARLMRQRREFEKIVEGLLVAAMDIGSFRKLDPRLATLQFLNLHNHTYQWVKPGGDWDAEYLSREYCATLISGFRSPDYQCDDLEERMVGIIAQRESEDPQAPKVTRKR
ncbi:TetR family transcriptional regulator [Amycolatopsis mediterranei S699]|uniref:TetR family transcriptional regulator n=2 Tax=Amycolatopsis mediterranei TaxID=33910 RepID=A0A0H3DGV0_AMYMU|nr:TetR/AcrR family transcriptional regulator [Amycolatopsis mediterranei]ADJ48864.1 TetR family transcriptional regulator [Amycolatopsis mediterranei U32]AEK45812.1 TetR family transcriptional regulator [Amycolatopsis mediterranei S699]AFO80572.1 TetR family transcriptional regulator [Amycolatopsis mediterranei S699]AGT87700.1 TetR family transcriptional regulator [Amycolatopsis mediterranei RB]KDU94021.1 TetR family transcriptional regulator [Amycolatopsis mediterranei]